MGTEGGCWHDVTWVLVGITTGGSCGKRRPHPGLSFGEATAMTDPLGDTAEDAERWWRAYQLAENDQAGELRERADAGDEHARRQLASWLADRGYTGRGLPDRARLDEAVEVIRPLADAGDEVAGLWLARWLADLDQVGELRQRAASGSYSAVHE